MKSLVYGLSKKISVPTAIAVISAVAAIASALFSYNQNQVLRKQLHLHVRPEVAIGLSVLKKEAYFQPVLTIRNQSPVSVASLSADYQFFQYDKATKRLRDQPTSSLTGEQSFKGHVLFQKKMEANDFVITELGNVISTAPTKRSIFVFVIFSTHYRESDMERFDNRKLYFFEDGKIFDQAGFMVHPDYETIFPLINMVRPPDLGSPENLPAETLLHRTKEEHNSVKTKTEKTKNQDDSRKPPSEPSGIRMLFTDD
jgi:hypothetical protein